MIDPVHTFRERTDKHSKMIGLLQFTLADFDDICEIFLDLMKKLLANATFTVEQPV